MGFNLGDFRHQLRGYALKGYRRFAVARRLRDIEHREPILVYQMGKVGSSTVVDTLERLDLPNPIVHIHTLNQAHLQRAIARQRASQSPFLHEHLLASQVLVRKLARGLFPCKVITLTRDPVARAISFVFEDWRKKAPQARSESGLLDVEVMQEELTELLRQENGIADPSRWFDHELRDVLGVDVFSVPYDHEQGFTILAGDPVSVLVLRLEDLNDAMVPALAEFLGLDPAQIVPGQANVGAAKWYAASLRAVKETYRLPSDVADSVLTTRYTRHFYEEDVKQLRKRWSASGEANA